MFNKNCGRAAAIVLATVMAFGTVGCGKVAEKQGSVKAEISTQDVEAKSEISSGTKNKPKKTGTDSGKGDDSSASKEKADTEAPTTKSNKTRTAAPMDKSRENTNNNKTVNDHSHTDNSKTTVENNYYLSNNYLQKNVAQVVQSVDYTQTTNNTENDIDVTNNGDIYEDHSENYEDANPTEGETAEDSNLENKNEEIDNNKEAEDNEDTDFNEGEEDFEETDETEDPYAGIVDITTEDMLCKLYDGYWISGMNQAQVIEFGDDGVVYEVGYAMWDGNEWSYQGSERAEFGTYDVDRGILHVYYYNDGEVTLKYVDADNGYDALESDDARENWDDTCQNMSAFENKFFYETAYQYGESDEYVHCISHVGWIELESSEVEEKVDGNSYEEDYEEEAYTGDEINDYEYSGTDYTEDMYVECEYTRVDCDEPEDNTVSNYEEDDTDTLTEVDGEWME